MLFPTGENDIISSSTQMSSPQHVLSFVVVIIAGDYTKCSENIHRTRYCRSRSPLFLYLDLISAAASICALIQYSEYSVYPS